MRSDFLSGLRPALILTLLFTILLCGLYPLAVLGIGKLAFPSQAGGSLIRDGGRVVGSSLIGQAFASDRYFHGRPSAAGKGYDPTASAGSNLSPTSKALATRIVADVKTLSASSPGLPVPLDLVTTSASGLDPDISPEAALFQVARVARSRGMSEEAVRRLVAEMEAHPIAGVIGEPRVNVLLLNRALDAAAPRS